MKKKWLSILLCVCMALSLLPTAALAADSTPSMPTTGDGSSGSPYQITSAAELYWFAALVNGTLTDGTAQNTAACAVLASDITVNAQVLIGGSLVSDTSALTVWVPIGGNSDATTYDSGPQYSGVFDGGNHTISGLYFNNEGKQYVGLFGYCKGATIKDLKLADSYIHGCQRVGGICGNSYLNSSISGCTSGAVVSASPYNNLAYVGGICGENNRASIEKCGNTGTVSANTSTESYCGGICGCNSGYTDIKSTISNCWNAGTVSASDGAGGICGRNYQYASITNCYNYGAVSKNTDCGAVVGVNGSTSTTLSNCYYDSSTSVSNGIGYDYSGSASVPGKTTAEFSSGEVCYLLNNGVSDGTQAWYQNIDVGTPETYPQFSGGTVYWNGTAYTNVAPVSISFNDYAPVKIYDAAALANPTADQLTLDYTSYGNVTFTWYKDSVVDSNKLESSPSAVGTYYVVADVAATATSSAASATSDAITISVKTVSSPTIELSGSSFPYTGAAIEPTVTVKDGSTIIDSSEYTVDYSNNTNAGSANVTISDADGGNYIVSGTQTFTITGTTPSVTVTATPPSSAAYGSTVILNAAVSGVNSETPTGTVTFKDGTNTLVSDVAVTADGTASYTWTNAGGGNHSITAMYTPAADGTVQNYSTATGTLNYTISKIAQAELNITNEPASVTYDDSFTLGSSGGTGDGAVTWAVTDGSSYATVDPVSGAVSIMGAGSVTITATKAGDDNCEDAMATYTFTAMQAEPNVGTVSYNSADLIYPATALATVNGKLVKSGTTAGTLALASDTTFTDGTNNYTWVFAPSDANYKPVTGTISLTVMADPLTGISIGATTPSKTAYIYGDVFETTGLTITANYTSGNSRIVTDAVAFSALTVGQTSVELSYTESGVTKTCGVSGITVAKASVTITGMTAPTDRVYNGTAIADSDFGTPSFMPSTYTGDDLTYTYYSGSIASGTPISAPKDAGTYTVCVAIPDNNADYVGNTDITFTIGKATVIATADDKSMTTGGTLPTLTVSYTGIVTGDTADSVFVTPAEATTTADGKTAGNYTITVTDPILITAAASNYTVGTSVSGTLTVSNLSYTGGGGSSASIVAVPVSSGEGSVNASASVSGGTATVSMTDNQIKEIASGAGATGTMKVDVSGLKINTVVVPTQVISAANGVSGTWGFEVALPTGSVTLDKTALNYITGKGDVKLSVDTVANSALTDSQKSTLGAQADSATVVDVNLYTGGSRVSTFGDGALQISIPYTLKSGENADSITVWFIKDDGTIEPKHGTYANGKVTFTTEHLSQYLIVNFPFTDVSEDAWYYNSVAYAYDNGLFSGTSATAFSPNTTMTRQMIWMVLARMDGKTPADMGAARAWAVENGISDGSNPTNHITREQMAVILYRYAQYKGYDTTQGGMSIREFADYNSISEYALPALAWAVNTGLVQGSNNNVMPSSNATRAQVATILQRFSQSEAK